MWAFGFISGFVVCAVLIGAVAWYRNKFPGQAKIKKIADDLKE